MFNHSHKKKNNLVTATTIVDFSLQALSMLKKPHVQQQNVNMAEEYMISVEDLKVFYKLD